MWLCYFLDLDKFSVYWRIYMNSCNNICKLRYSMETKNVNTQYLIRFCIFFHILSTFNHIALWPKESVKTRGSVKIIIKKGTTKTLHLFKCISSCLGVTPKWLVITFKMVLKEAEKWNYFHASHAQTLQSLLLLCEGIIHLSDVTGSFLDILKQPAHLFEFYPLLLLIGMRERIKHRKYKGS